MPPEKESSYDASKIGQKGEGEVNGRKNLFTSRKNRNQSHKMASCYPLLVLVSPVGGIVVQSLTGRDAGGQDCSLFLPLAV